MDQDNDINNKTIRMNRKEESLKMALNAVRIPELPKQLQDDSNEYWLEAIVLVRKRDSTTSYAVARRDPNGRIKYTADFGSMSQITALVSIHPYTFLNKEKYLQEGSIEQKRFMLTQFIGGDNDAEVAVAAMTDEEVESAVLSIAVEAQYGSKSVQETHSRILEAVKGNSPEKEENTEDESVKENSVEAVQVEEEEKEQEDSTDDEPRKEEEDGKVEKEEPRPTLGERRVRITRRVAGSSRTKK